MRIVRIRRRLRLGPLGGGGARLDVPLVADGVAEFGRLDIVCANAAITGFVADDKKSVALSFTWDAEHMTLGEANIAIDNLAGLVKELCRAENWDKSVREIMGLVM